MQRAAGSYATGPAGSGAEGADTPVLDPFLEMDRLPSLKCTFSVAACECTQCLFRCHWACFGDGVEWVRNEWACACAVARRLLLVHLVVFMRPVR